jgi:hypothetical protein
MASLSNINGLFDVHSTGAILFSTSHGTSGQILRSNGNAAPTWVDASTVIGGPYLPLTGGTLTGATATASGISFTVGGALTGTSATFSGTLTGTSATFVRDASGYALRLDSGDATTDNDLRFAKGGTDYAAIQINAAATSDFEFYVNDGTNWINTLTFARADGQATFTKLVSGITPTAAANFATKAYVDAQPQGDITEITLGNGLTGSNLSGPIPNVLMSGSYTGKFTIDSTGDVEYLALNTTATTNKRVRLQFTQNDNAGMEIGTDYSVDNSSNFYFYDRVAGSAMLFTSVASSFFPGSLRIGMTAASSQKLHVQGSNHFVTFENTSTTANHYSQMLLQAGSAKNFIWTANQNSTNWGGANSLNIYTQQAGAIAFFTTATKRMTIQAAGNVFIENKLGIGNSNPTAKLAIGPTMSSSATGISVNVGVGEGNLIGIGNNNHNWFPFTNGQNYYSSDVHNFRNASHSTTYMVLDSVGLGIGTTSPSSKLELGPNGSLGANITNKNVILNVDGGYGTTGTPTSGQYKVIGFTGTTKDVTDITGQTSGEVQKNFYLGMIGGDYFNVNRFSFWQGGSERLTIQGYGANAGNVGINKVDPSYKLDVEGDIRLGGTDAQNYPIKMGRDNHAIYLGGPNINTMNVGWDTNSDYNLHLNYVGYAGGVTQFRNLVINNGKQGHIATFKGSTGRVGIGTDSPDAKLEVVYGGGYNVGIKVRSTSGYAVMTLEAPANNYPILEFKEAGTQKWQVFNEPSDDSLNFYAWGAGAGTRMKILQSGNLGINNTSPDAYLRVDGTTSVTAARFYGTGGTRPPLELRQNNTAGWFAKFYSDNFGTYIGGISFYGSSTTFNTSSDYRLKENIIPISDSITRLKQLKPSRFNFKQYPEITIDGFLAHEVQDIVPEAVTGNKDGLDSDGKPVYQAIDHSRLIPLLVASIQELEARVKELENK